MAMIPVNVAVAAVDTVAATFAKPVANYKKTAPSATVTDGGGPVVAIYSGADVDNGNGTMTATIKFSAAFTGEVNLTVYDAP